MKIPIKLHNGVFIPIKPSQAEKLVNGAVYTLDVHKQRTLAQNRALHKYFNLLAYELNNRGQHCWCETVRGYVMWSDLLIKELIWRPMQKLILNKVSTSDLDIGEINKIYEKVSEVIFDRFYFTLPFPKE